MKGMFSKMSIFDESPRESPTNSPESSGVVEGQAQQSQNSIEARYATGPEMDFDESMLNVSDVWDMSEFFPPPQR